MMSHKVIFVDLPAMNVSWMAFLLDARVLLWLVVHLQYLCEYIRCLYANDLQTTLNEGVRLICHNWNFHSQQWTVVPYQSYSYPVSVKSD